MGLFFWDVSSATTFGSAFEGTTSLDPCNKKRSAFKWKGNAAFNSTGLFSLWNTETCHSEIGSTLTNDHRRSNILLAAWDWINFGSTVATETWGDIEGWDTSRVTSLSALFSESRVGTNVREWLGADLTKWDTGNAVSFEQTFKGNSKFNGNMSTFQLQKTTHLGEMFRGCESFNGQLGTWDVSKGVDTNSMFRDASKFVSVKP